MLTNTQLTKQVAEAKIKINELTQPMYKALVQLVTLHSATTTKDYSLHKGQLWTRLQSHSYGQHHNQVSAFTQTKYGIFKRDS